jgi:hypothetical protein
LIKNVTVVGDEVYRRAGGEMRRVVGGRKKRDR